MKKIFLLFAFMALIIFSCKKQDDYVAPKTYASYVSGEFVPSNGDIYLKNAPLVGGHDFSVYDKKVGQTNFSLVDGTEFLTGSAPALDWTGFVHRWFAADQAVYCTYCPVLPLRVVVKTTEGDANSTVTYLGFWDGTPNANSFPITVNCKRLGDILTLDASALTSLPGYKSLSFDVTFTKSVIDIPNTILNSPSYTDNEWPTYSYVVGAIPTTSNFTTPISNVYTGYDAKITGIITIVVNVDNTKITLPVINASNLGYGMNIVLHTNKIGWYDSGTILITEKDIQITTVNIDVN
jgi:hypothetical protein